MLGKLGPMELLLILAIALVIFGPGKLPEIGEALGKGIRDFQRALKQSPTTDNNSPQLPTKDTKEPKQD